MTGKCLPPFFLITALFFYSCDSLFGPEKPLYDLPQDPSFGNFWAQDIRARGNGRFYRVDAELFGEGEGTYCNVYVEKGSGISEETAGAIANTYDTKIYPKMKETFGFETIVDGETLDAMQYADGLGDKDGKLCILLLDIKDDYIPFINGSYVAGYFWAENLYSKSSQRYSNERDMIYVDTSPGKPGSDESNGTLAHELQHLISYVADKVYRNSSTMDLWINEGLSGAAEWVYGRKHPESRLDWLNDDWNESFISQGNNFFVWGNYEKQNPYAVLDDYATVYLFFQWLRIQSPNPESTRVYSDIITSTLTDYKAVTNSIEPGVLPDDWENLLKAWLAANYINKPTGLYGYESDPDLGNIRAKLLPREIQNEYFGKKFPLYPGEAVYTKFRNDLTLPSASPENPDIKYAGLSESGGISDDTAAAGDALLTFNSSVEKTADSQSGAIKGYAADIGVGSRAKTSRGVFSGPPLPGPFPVGAGDMLRRNGRGR